MTLIDKKNILSRADGVSHIELELGCGNTKRNRQCIGIDMLDYPDVDIVGDIYEVLASFPNQSVDAVYSYHFIEHVNDVSSVRLNRVVFH